MKKKLKAVNDLTMGIVMSVNFGVSIGCSIGAPRLGRNLSLCSAVASAGIGAWCIRDFVKENTKDDSYVIYK